MLYKKISTIALVIIFIFALSESAQAGFGITPPYVKSNKLIPGSHYEQRITLLRSSAEEDLKAIITINAPEIESWISIDKGEEFDLPKDALRVPMVVKVDPPEDAALGEYKGYLNIRIAPKDEVKSSGVSIALGARVDIDLTLTDEINPNFLVKTVSIPSFEILKKPWRWQPFGWFFYRLNVMMKIENTGNVKISPTKVDIDIYDISDKKLLETHTDKRFDKIEPFDTQTIKASFPIKLDAGQYWGRVKIYKENQIVRNDKISFTIADEGAMPEGVLNLGIWPWIMSGVLLMIGLTIIFILIKIRIWIFLKKIILFILWPLKFLIEKVVEKFNKIKIKFWKWMHKKSVQYQNIENKNKQED